MRSFTITALFAALALVSAQGTPPACALTCSTSTKTPCSATDYKCICTNQDAIVAIAKCIQSTCSASDVKAAQDASSSLCQTLAGVTLSLPESLTATTAGGSATGDASKTTGSQSATSPATVSPTATGGALSNGVSVAAGIVAVALGVVAL